MVNEKQFRDPTKMVRLIDANALVDLVLNHPKPYRRDFYAMINNAPTVDAVPVEQYKALVEMYHDLRENFIDYVCSGTCNVAPYCLNRCEGCVDRVGWCSQGSDECHGFNPAEVILDDAKMDGDGNG